MDDDVMTFRLNLIASCQLCMAWLGYILMCAVGFTVSSNSSHARFTTHWYRHGYPYGGSGDNRSHRSRINETPFFTTHIGMHISLLSCLGAFRSYPVQFSTPAYCLSIHFNKHTHRQTRAMRWGSSTWHEHGTAARTPITVELARHLLGPVFIKT